MRFALGLVGLLVALAIVGVLAKKQMSATKVALPPGISAPAEGASAPRNVREQSQQIQQQVQQQINESLQQQQKRLEQQEQ